MIGFSYEKVSSFISESSTLTPGYWLSSLCPSFRILVPLNLSDFHDCALQGKVIHFLGPVLNLWVRVVHPFSDLCPFPRTGRAFLYVLKTQTVRHFHVFRLYSFMSDSSICPILSWLLFKSSNSPSFFPLFEGTVIISTTPTSTTSYWSSGMPRFFMKRVLTPFCFILFGCRFPRDVDLRHSKWALTQWNKTCYLHGGFVIAMAEPLFFPIPILGREDQVSGWRV